jgi:hypothetical protein
MLKIPGRSADEEQAALNQAARLDALLQKASPAQKRLMEWLARRAENGQYTLPAPNWVELILTATQDISAEDLAYLEKLEWQPDRVTAERLRKNIQEALKRRKQAQQKRASAPDSPPDQAAKPGKRRETKDKNDGGKAKGKGKGEGGKTRGKQHTSRPRQKDELSTPDVIAKLAAAAATIDFSALDAGRSRIIWDAPDPIAKKDRNKVVWFVGKTETGDGYVAVAEVEFEALDTKARTARVKVLNTTPCVTVAGLVVAEPEMLEGRSFSYTDIWLAGDQPAAGPATK